ncbi:MAG: anti-sigma factor antagonist [Planctomycetes bacterium]|nr:anti-sigma factor antagonist [Planctomycetota bacterium]
MASDTSRLRFTVQGSVLVVEFADRDVLDEAAIRQINSELIRQIEAAKTSNVLICFNGVEHLSSAALGTLITVNSLVKKRGGQLRLSNIKSTILEVFRITKLDRLFQISDSADQALAAFPKG